jgi:Undecaprenyl-phosphate glucose phosphotransferase
MSESTFSRAAEFVPSGIRRRDIRSAVAILVSLIEMTGVGASAYAAFVAYHMIVWSGLPDTISYGWICTGLAAMYWVICLADKQYDYLGSEWDRQALRRGALALALAFVFLLTTMFLTGTVTNYSRGTFVSQLALALPVQILIRAALWRTVEIGRRRSFWREPGVVVLMFPGVERSAQLLASLSSRREHIHQIHYLESDQVDSQVKTILQECRASNCESVLVLFDADSMDVITRTVGAISELPVRVQLLPIGMLDFMHCSRVGVFGRARVLEIVSGPNWVADRLLKRGLDLVLGTTAALLLTPVMTLVALLIKLDSPGPILFRQLRDGFNNEPITVLKFRTMVTRQEQAGFQQATRDDPRITRIGRILRRTNLDELPQLFNVIKGEMSLVGPRPHAISHNQMFDGQISRLSRRHNVKPGITGWAQVNGFRGETDTFEKMQARVEHDLYYIDNWSFAFDLKILVMTIFSRKSYENAY